MKKQFLIIVFLMMGTFFYGQQKQFSVGPQNFRDKVGCKVALEKPTDLTVNIKYNNKTVKTFEFKNAQTEPVFMDMSDLEKGQTYKLQIFNSKKEKMHEVLIKKLNK